MSFLRKLKPTNTPRAYFYDAAVTFVIAAVLIFFLIGNATKQYAFIQIASHADGVITRLTSGKHHVEVKFTTADGRAIEYAESSWASYDEGEKVVVYYDPRDPDKNPCTGSFLALWDGTIALSYMASIATFITLGLVYFPKYFYGPFSNAYERDQKRARERQQSRHS